MRGTDLVDGFRLDVDPAATDHVFLHVSIGGYPAPSQHGVLAARSLPAIRDSDGYDRRVEADRPIHNSLLMTRAELIDVIAKSIAHHEGYYVTAQEAQKRGIKWPTRAQRNRNPGNLRRWDPKRDKYDDVDPAKRYVIFDTDSAGWSALRKLCDQYLKGKYHQGKPPSLRQWFKVYAPAEDANNPESYAAGVAKALTAAGVKDVSVDRSVVEYVGD